MTYFFISTGLWWYSWTVLWS